MSAAYTLSAATPATRSFALRWLWLGVAALIVAGLFAILLVLSRTPGVQAIIPWVDFFRTALVVHVDMSVFIWFVAFAGVLWSVTLPLGTRLNTLALLLCAAGGLLMAVLPFAGVGAPLMNNYLPVLQHPAFLLALALIGAGFGLLTIDALGGGLHWRTPFTPGDALRFGSLTAALAAALALLVFLWTLRELPTTLDAHGYFEFLFWGAGHVLQFTHTQLLILCWLVLGSAAGLAIGLAPRTVIVLFALGIAPLLYVPILALQHPVLGGESRLGYTRLMQYGGGIASVPLGLYLLWRILRDRPALTPEQRPLRNALYSSLLLFAAGGIIALLIEGVNVVIPAHYHGSIVGVTLAFMGTAYYLLPKLGYPAPVSWAARWQPGIYGGGQLLHILGLAWSGGYGVQRKTAGAAQQLERLPEIAGMAMMGLGGLVAVIGGLLFVIVMLRSLLWRRG